MRAVRVIGGRPSVVDVARPSGEGVVVDVRSAGICGSDLHLLPLLSEVPVTLGHEFAGVLDDGRPVAVEPMAPCRRCGACRRGNYHLCEQGSTTITLGVGLDGGMAERCLVPAEAIVPLPAGLEPDDACLVEPLAVAVHGVRRGRLRGEERVAVVGGGSIGLCSIVAALATGAEVSLECRYDHQRAAGGRLGARDLAPDAGGFDLVIEAAGTESALARAVHLARPGGRVVVVGTYWDSVVLPGLELGLKEVSIVPAITYNRRGGARDVDIAAALLATRPEIAATLVTHRFPLDAAPEAFATAADRTTGAIKVVLDPRAG